MHGLDDSAQTLMDSLVVIVLNVLVDHVVKLLHGRKDQVIEALLLDLPDKPFCERIEVRAPGGKLDGLNAYGLQDGIELLGEQWISVMDKKPMTSQEALFIGHVPGDLLHPFAIGLWSDPQQLDLPSR
jgi:hypothetical protein